MARTSWYYMLMASLPALPPVFTVHQTPISRLRLQRRLRLLADDDARELSAIEDVMHWDRSPLGMTDSAIVQRAREVIPGIRSSMLRQVATWRLERRTVVAALRRRAWGGTLPEDGGEWGYGRWVGAVERNWDLPDFGLTHVLPWVPDVCQRIERGDVEGVERAVLGFAWSTLCSAHEQHYFDYEAVVLYVLRWNVIARWTSYDGARACERFDVLTDDGVGRYSDVFAADTTESMVAEELH